MKTIRRDVFETNSSSTHSLSILQVDRKYTRTGKIVGVCEYKTQRRGKNVVLSSEQEKMCGCLDMLFSDFENEYMTMNKGYPKDLSKYLREPLKGTYYAKKNYEVVKFLKDRRYKVFLRVLSKHNVEFKETDELYNMPYSSFKFDETNEYIPIHSLDELVNQMGVPDLYICIEELIFNPRYKIEV